MDDTRQPAPRYLAVVRRGETEEYSILKDYLGRRGVIDVVWDRRVGERRRAARPPTTGPERRGRDRRQGPQRDLASRPLGFFLVRTDRNRR